MHGTRFQNCCALGALALLVCTGHAAAQDDQRPAPAGPVVSAPQNLVLAHGRHVGTGISGQAITGLGFAPDVVIVKSEGSAQAYGRTSTMTGTTSKNLASTANSAGNRITSLDADGFTLGSASEVNSPGVAYQWVAFRALAGVMSVGSYAGNGLDNRDITGLGFDPNLVIIVPQSGRPATIRFPDQRDNESFPFENGSGKKGNRIQDFVNDGFEVGNDDHVNALLSTYHYVAWRTEGSLVAVGAYEGNSSSPRTITTGALRPSYALVRGDLNEGLVHRSVTLLGNQTLPMDTGSAFGGGVRAFLTSGFQVGADPSVNDDGDEYYWAAFSTGDVLLADASVDIQVDDVSPDPGEMVRYHVLATNVGTLPFSALQLRVQLPSQVAYLAHTLSAGLYDPLAGSWELTTLGPGETDSLEVQVAVANGTDGATLRTSASLLGSVPQDVVTFNNSDSLDIVVGDVTDLAVTLHRAPAVASEADTVTYTVQVANLGPDDAFGVTVSDSLSAGLTAAGSTVTHGSFDAQSGEWTIGNLAAGTTATLELRAVMTSGGFSRVSHWAAIVQAQPPDPNPLNDHAETHTGTMIAEAVALAAEPVHPGDRNVGLLGIRLTNFTALPASLAALQIDAQGGLDTLRVWLDDGDLQLDPTRDIEIAAGAGPTWTAAFPAVPVTWQRTLLVSGDVSSTQAPHGSGLDARVLLPAGVSWSTPVSLVSVRGFPLDSPGQIDVVDLVRAQIEFTPLPAGTTFPGSTGVPLLHLRVPDDGGNADVLERFDVLQIGSASAGVDVVAMWLQRLSKPSSPDGVSAPGDRTRWIDVEAGELVHTGGQRWSASSLAMPVPPGGAELRVVADIAAAARHQTTLHAELPADAMRFDSGRRGPVDAAWRNPDATTIHAENIMVVTPGALVSATPIARTARHVPVLALQLVARGATADTLAQLRLWNDSSGPPGATPHLPVQIASADLWHDVDASGDTGPADVHLQALAPGLTGELAFGSVVPLDVQLTPYETLHVLVTMTPDPVLIRDAEELAARLDLAADVVTRGGLLVSLPATLRTPVAPRVDGQAAAGYAVTPQASRPAFASSTDVVGLDFALPSNGIDADVVESLRVENAGTATSADIARMWLRRDDGIAGVGAGDLVVAELVPTAAQTWEANDIGLVIPSGSAPRFLVTFDVAAEPAPGATFRARVETGGIDVQSGNDGPNDVPLDGGEPIVLVQADHVVWLAGVAGDRSVSPNAARQPVLVLEAFNAYTAPRTLEGLTVRLTGTADAREVPSWGLYADTNQDGALDDADSPPLATASPQAGELQFDGFDHALPAWVQHRLFVAYTLAPGEARDDSRIDAEIAGAGSFHYTDTTSGAGAFPLDSPGADRIDGHVVAQIDNAPVTSRTLGGGETNVLALDVTLPSNGWVHDTLTTLDVELAPGASAAVLGPDVAAMRLWRESGASAGFDAGDVLLATGSDLGARVRFGPIAVPISPGGSRFYVTVDAAAAPTDGRILQLVLPVNGALMRSGNDGPLDGAVASTATHSFSTSPLPVTVAVEALPAGSAPVRPGDRNVTLLTLRFVNQGGQPRRLDALRVAADGALDTLRVWVDDGNLTLDPVLDTLVAAGVPGTWLAAQPGIDIVSQRTLFVSGDVGLLNAPHASVVDARIAALSDLVFAAPTQITATGGLPLDSPGMHGVTGVVLAQLGFTATPADTTFPSALGVPLLELHVPDNGGLIDVLQRFDVQHVGSAIPDTDIAAMWLQVQEPPARGIAAAGAARGLWLDVDAGQLVHTGGGRWSASALAMPVPIGGAHLRVVADVAGTARNALTLQAELPADAMQFGSGRRGPVDGSWRNPTASTIRAESILEVTPAAVVRPPGPVARSAHDVPVLAMRLVARSPGNDALTRLRLWNATSGPAGASPSSHLQIASVGLWIDNDESGDLGPGDTPIESRAPGATGELLFGDAVPLDVVLTPHTPLPLLVTMTPDTALVRDAELLGVVLQQATDVQTGGGLIVSLAEPIRTATPPQVDGQAASGYAVTPLASQAMFGGSDDVVVLDMALPANGIDADVLESMRVENAGTATTADVERVLLRHNDGSPGIGAGDVVIAELIATTERAWEAHGIGLNLQGNSAARFLVTLDVRSAPARGATFRARVPAGGVTVASGNDGPNDTPLDGGEPIVFMQPNNVTWIAGVAGQRIVHPGPERHPVLVLEAFNAYDSPRVLEALEVRLTGTAAEQEFEGWGLYPDTNLNGLLDSDEAMLAVAIPHDGSVLFEGFAYVLPARQQRRLLVTYTLFQDGVRDDSRIDADVIDESSFRYREATSGAGAFPLDSAGFDRVDGHVAAQIDNGTVIPRTLGGGETDVLAMNLVLPANGWQADTLTGLEIEIAALADAATLGADVAAVRLWRESGVATAATFDSGTDVQLATGVAAGQRIVFPELAAAIPPGGSRFYVTIDAALTPGDGRRLQLVLPVDGAEMRSGNDGPVDASVVSPATHLFSARDLLASVSVSPSLLGTGQQVDVVVDVLNRGPDPLTGIIPFDITAAPYAAATWIAGPTPAQVDLLPQESAAFTYRFQLDAPGMVAFTAIVGTSDSAVVSAPARSSSTRVENPAAPLDLELRSNLPVSVSRGQSNLTALFWQFDYPTASGEVAAVRVHHVRFHVENASGTPQSAASVFAALEIRTGGLVHASWSTIPDSSVLDVSLNPPVVLQSGEERDLPLTVSVAGDAAASSFRLRLDSDAVQATDATSGLPVTVNATLPWSTTAASVRTPAPFVDAAATRTLPATANRGQADVAAGRWTLTVPGAPGESEARVTRFAIVVQDASGADLAGSQVLTRARIRSGGTTLAEATGLELAAPNVTLAFDIPGVVVSGAPEELELWLDLAPSATVPAFQIAVLDSNAIDAKDANTGSVVPVRLQAANWPWSDGPTSLQDAAALADFTATSQAPATSLPGATGVQVAQVVLRHRDPPGSAAMRVAGLTFAARDDADRAPNQILRGARLLETNVLRSEASALPGSGNQVLLPLDVLLMAGDSLTLDLELDLAPTLASQWLRIALGIDAFDLVDANDPTNVIAPAGKSAFETGFVRIVAPSRTMALGVASEPVTNVLRGSTESAVLTIRLAHPGALNEEPIQPQELTLDVRQVNGSALPATAIATAARLHAGDAVVEGVLDGATLRFDLSGVAALAAAGEMDLQLAFDFAASPSVSDFRLGFGAGGLRASGNVGQVEVSALAGQALPYESPTIHFVTPDLDASLAAYPNPFRPHEHPSCRVTVYLAADADVTCDIYTLSGERVVRAMRQQPMKAGLHVLPGWDGKNSEGRLVRSGMYLLRVKVDGPNGGEVFRKVAVVR